MKIIYGMTCVSYNMRHDTHDYTQLHRQIRLLESIKIRTHNITCKYSRRCSRILNVKQWAKRERKTIILCERFTHLPIRLAFCVSRFDIDPLVLRTTKNTSGCHTVVDIYF